MKVGKIRTTGQIVGMQDSGDEEKDAISILKNAANDYPSEEIIIVDMTAEAYKSSIRNQNFNESDNMQKRVLSYDPIGDQLDRIFKTIKYLKEHGVDIGLDGEELVARNQAVKDKYPKP